MRPQPSALASASPWVLLLLTVAGFLVLMPGNSGLSIYSGKDEYFLSMRVVLSMHEGGQWWIPVLDGEPRLRKPPGLYWSARAVFELCGNSMFCLRLPAILWALTWLAALGALARWFFPRHAVAAQFFGGMVLMLSAGWLIEGRRLMLDLPVTACASLAYWASLRSLAPNIDALSLALPAYAHVKRWLAQLAWWIAAAAFLAYGFLIKGPVVWLIWSTGLLALLLHPQLGRAHAIGKPGSLRWRLVGGALLSFLLGMALAAPWFVDVASQTTLVSEVLEQEVQARMLGAFSLAPLAGFWLISAPWGLYLLFGLLALRRFDDGFASTSRSLLLWLVLGLLPFFLMQSFERYLLGALVPVALLLAGILAQNHLRERLLALSPWIRIASALPMVLLISLVSLFLIWFDIAVQTGSLALLMLIIFIIIWWQSTNLMRLAFAMFCWLLNVLIFVSITYPAMGINQAPEWLVQHARSSELIFWEGPHPALLAAYSGKAHRHLNTRRDSDFDQLESGQWFVLAQVDRASLEQTVKRRGWTVVEVGQWRALVNQGSALRFWRPGSDLKAAISAQDLSGIQTELVALRLEKGQ